MLSSLLNFDPRQSTLPREVMAGAVTFLTMSYILFVNPMILSDAGMDFGAVLTATALATAAGTLMMAFRSKVPLAMAPGMGLNAFFAYSLVIGQGINWETALGVVFVSGVFFLLLTLLGIREKIVKAIPLSLRLAIPSGIGLFIAFIGFQNMGLVTRDEATMIAIGQFSPALALGLAGLLITAGLVAHKVRGAILFGILGTTLLAIFSGEAEMSERIFSMPPSIAPVFLQLDVAGALSWGLMGAIFSLMFVDLFDSVGTLVACSYEAGLVREDGSIRNIDKMLEADAAATITGALLGTSTTTAYIESMAGIEEGGRSGVTAVVVAVFFLFALFFTPLIMIVPAFGTAPALVVVGILMFRGIKKIPLDDWTDVTAAFMTILLMPLTYSISHGLTFGFLFWVLLKTVSGEWRAVHPVMWIVGLLSAINLMLTL